MSGFFGIFRPQGGPVDLEAFEQMKTAMHRDGFDGMETHVEEKIAMGHLMLRVSPESKYDKQPLKSSCGNYMLVGHFRLDYRDELGDKLGLTQSELELTPDSQLAMLAYLKWKEECVHHLEGDWAFVIFDFISQSLFIAKDPFGYSAIFFRKSGGSYYFSSLTDCISGISSLKNEINFIEFFRQSVPNVGPSLHETLLTDVFSFKAGTYALVDFRLKEEMYNFINLNNLPITKYRDELDYSYLLSSIFSQAVKSKIRVNSSVGIFLSGGLDSTGVAHFSSKELSFRGDLLHSFTSFPLYLSEISEKHLKIANEVPLVKMFSQTHENVKTNFVNFPKSRISDLLLSDYTNDDFTPIVNPNNFWIDGILSELRNKNIRVVLNGQLGNFTLTPSAPFIHVEMFFSFHFISLFQELKSIAKNSSKSITMTFRDRILSPLKFQLSTLKRHLLLYRSNMLFNQSLFDQTYSGFKFLRGSSHFQNVPYFSFVSSSRKLRIIQVLSTAGNGGKMWYKEAEKKGIQISDPTSDSRLIFFSFSIPEEEYNKMGKYKAVYRRMMHKRIPDEILYNPQKMLQSFDIHPRFKTDQNLAKILQELINIAHLIPFVKIKELKNLYNKILISQNMVSAYEDIFNFLRITSLIIYYLEKNHNFTPNSFMEKNFSGWIKPSISQLNTSSTSDPGLSCLAQNPNKLGGTIDGLTSNNPPCSS